MTIIQKIINFFKKIKNPAITANTHERTDIRDIRKLKRLTVVDQVNAESQRDLKEISNAERKRLEQERLQQIHSLYETQFREYLQEAQKFRTDFGKNIQCDVCGKWDSDLIFHKNQTYCEHCIPPSYDSPKERKITAGRHGASKNFIKK